MTPSSSHIDASGLFGTLFHYALLFAMMGSAGLAMLYFWRKGALSYDESVKNQPFEDDDEEGSNEK